MEALERAREFATRKHVHERGHLHGEHPYTRHLEAVEGVLLRFGVDDEVMRAAAWLHDVVEDCEVTRSELAAEFGPDVAGVVWGVTNEPGASRRERHAATYPKTRSDSRSVLLKLADRIANVEAGGPQVEMYRTEHPAFRAALYQPREHAAMWAHLDGLLAPA